MTQQVKITTSKAGHPVIALTDGDREVISSRAVAEYIYTHPWWNSETQTAVLAEAIRLIKDHYTSPKFCDLAVKDLEEYHGRFYLRLIDGDDIVSPAFASHKSATWARYNHRNADGSYKYCTSGGTPCVYVWESKDEVACPQCGNMQYFMPEGAPCEACGAWVE